MSFSSPRRRKLCFSSSAHRELCFSSCARRELCFFSSEILNCATFRPNAASCAFDRPRTASCASVHNILSCAFLRTGRLYLPPYLPAYLFFEDVGRVSSLASSSTLSVPHRSVPRAHSFGGACCEPLDPTPWLSLSLLPRPLNLEVKGLGVQARQFNHIWVPPSRASLSLPACTRSHTYAHARTLTRTLTGTHISSSIDPLVRGSVVGHLLYFRFFFRLVCDYVPEVARNLSGSKRVPIHCCSWSRSSM